MPAWNLLLAIGLAALAVPAGAAEPYASARQQMVQSEIVGGGIENPRVIEAMRSTPRHLFVLPSQRPHAYFDLAMPIGYGQTISPPYVVAFMTEQLDPQPTDKVLEIGTGSGYQAAVLSGLVDQVYSIEIVEPLGRKAAATLRGLRYANVHTKIGDGFQGWPEHAPFDKIIVTCSPENIPRPLIDQLAEGGRIVVPLGERFQQVLYLFTKVDGKLEKESLQGTFFVPMTGVAEQQRQVLPDGARPRLAYGSFEQTLDSSDEPEGWFYVRQGRVVDDAQAPDGKRCMFFSNSTPGRDAHAMQAFGVDGREVRQLQISLMVRGASLQPDPSQRQQASVMVEFYGANRSAVGLERLGPSAGDFDWTLQQLRVNVPPTARLAVVGIGLFGITGQAWFDRVEVQAAGGNGP